VLNDGSLLSGHFLDRERRILFRVDGSLVAELPSASECTEQAVVTALHFLTDQWLIDVPTDFAGKVKLLALASTALQRGVLPERPCFFVTAGQRGNGKTTAINMVSVAVVGHTAAAAAWSFSKEEQRKSLLSYLQEGLPLIVWDNIERGATIASSSIEKSLTLPTYSDRVLGVTGIRVAPATSIHVFSGNNVSPKGDLASRALLIRLTAERADPENRSFTHHDPIGWTYAHRIEILRALYTIILGNPKLTEADPGGADTRFKTWWRLIGSAYEHAVKCVIKRWPRNTGAQPEPLSFRKQFLSNDGDDEQGSALATVLGLLRAQWPGTFTAADVLAYAYAFGDPAAANFAREFFDAIEAATGRNPPREYSARSLSWRLKALIDAPVEHDGKLLCLRWNALHQANQFEVQVLKATP
jgi:hypothetical protein